MLGGFGVDNAEKSHLFHQNQRKLWRYGGQMSKVSQSAGQETTTTIPCDLKHNQPTLWSVENQDERSTCHFSFVQKLINLLFGDLHFKHKPDAL